MEILIHPNDALRVVCTPVETVTKQLREQLEEMRELLYEKKAYGVSAPQVGLTERVLVMNSEANPRSTECELTLINPVIERRRGGITKEMEGCLSIPHEFGMVRRSAKVHVTGWKLDGTKFQAAMTGMAARVIQHEIDHLDGILFIDKMED
jgi:peptide deformylase